jgi:AraC-like DNA-binding protein
VAGHCYFERPSAEQFQVEAKNMTSNLPLIRLSAINPFLLELRRRRIDPRPMLKELALPTDVPASKDLFVASTSVYEVVQKSAELANDPHLGHSVGSGLDLSDWDPIIEATEKARTVGELLTMFALNAAEHSTATNFYITTEGDRSTFGFDRVVKPAFRPGQIDAFYMGLMLRLLRHATRDHWEPSNVLFTVADPHCIPPSNEPYRIAKGDRSGVRVGFPTQWMFEIFEKSQFKTRLNKESSTAMPRSLLDSLRSALGPHLHVGNLTADKAAKICGHDRRRLSRELRAMGTTLSKEITKLRTDKASRALVDTDRKVAEIAEAVGFADPTVFSRAFKNWTGQSPREYRRTHKSPD